ncbi:hypothetical protein [Mucilaginibacter celer]|uniref:Uncharacterized protein n=1 Tax=Mucilaginibacter celer TaxID=2305508 RepID=A0A494W2H3_9SPHI|nr:hypothetical protein [Mucilaginibacter celer]AYL97758.1 hypothetical protein HYN43_021760 [Mucilaginibacter celer]
MDLKEDWIALFDKDLLSKTFLWPGNSNQILYWIKRYENGKYHYPRTTNNKYKLRSFEFFDSQLKPTALEYGGLNKWECVRLEEKALDASGSYCFCSIKDPLENSLSVRMHGRWNTSHGGFVTSISQDLYISCLMLFLKELSVYKNWEDLKVNNLEMFTDITKLNGVPQSIFERVEKGTYKF